MFDYCANKNAFQEAYNNIAVDLAKKERPIVVQDGIIYPYEHKQGDNILLNYGGVTDATGKYIKESALERHYGKIVSGIQKRIRSPKKSDEKVVYLGVFFNHYGHFLLESLSRLSYALKKDDCDIKYAYIGDFALFEPYKTMLSLVGIEEADLIKITEPTQFKEVVIPLPSYRIADYISEDYTSIIERIKSSLRANKKYKKIYLSRGKYDDGKTFGEKQIEATFRRNGYKIIFPEKLPITEQISMMMGCDTVAGITGSHMHNVVFCRKNTKIINLNRLSTVPANQIAIELGFRLKGVYIDTYLDILPNNIGMGPFILGLNDSFKKYLVDNRMAFDERLFLKSKRKNIEGFIEKWGKIYSKEAAYFWIKDAKFNLNDFAKNLAEHLG